MTSIEAEIESTILALLQERAAGASICPSDAARAVAEKNHKDWRDLMNSAREVAVRMTRAGRLKITRGTEILDPDALGRGPVRLRLP